jgi:3-oxoadipate enol-lactonase
VPGHTDTDWEYIDMKIRIGNIEFNYEIHGSAGLPWLTLSHSLACSLHMWDPQIAALSDRYRILAYDTRGHGLTTPVPGPYDFEMLAEDVRGLLDALDIRRTHFAGLSMGGMTGQALTLAHPERVDRLILADTGHFTPPEGAAMWRERVALAQAGGLEALVEPTLKRWCLPDFAQRDPAGHAKLAQMIRTTSFEGFSGCAHALMRTNFTERLPAITRPTLALAGSHDASLAATRQIAERIPGARFVEIASAGHITSIEQPAQVTQALAEFLAG